MRFKKHVVIPKLLGPPYKGIFSQTPTEGENKCRGLVLSVITRDWLIRHPPTSRSFTGLGSRGDIMSRDGAGIGTEQTEIKKNKERQNERKREKVSVLLDCSIVSSDEFVPVDDDNMCTASIMTDKNILGLDESSKNIIDADSDDENETNNAIPVPTSTEMRNILQIFGLAIHQNDHQARRRFVEWVQNEIAVVLDFHKRILFSDEAHFWLNGYVNKQNCRISSEANPQVYVETPLHPEKLTVWCALWAGGILLQKR
ncbi:hypothetical protein TNCV_3972321 [Trichonephila clavipes]|nr:hypothetical protein TNCV_3972321 [Trichonephila clavipes]